MTIDIIDLLVKILRDIPLHIENESPHFRHLEISICNQMGNTGGRSRYDVLVALWHLSTPSADHRSQV